MNLNKCYDWKTKITEDLNEDLNLRRHIATGGSDDIKLAQIKLPLSWETFQYMVVWLHDKQHKTLPEPLKNQWKELEDKEDDSFRLSIELSSDDKNSFNYSG